LKYFSNNNQNKHIGVYIFKTKTWINEANLKNQSYENYFYDKDGMLEDALSTLENISAESIRKIDTTYTLPKPSTEDFKAIWVFTFLQATRTKSIAKETNEMTNKLFKIVFKNDPRFKGNINNLEFGIKNTAAFNIDTTIKTMYYAKDLACKLIVNKSSIPFITSDNPVVRYNQFLERRKFPGGLTGFASKGLQIFFPITPNLMLLFYDDKVYKCGLKKRSRLETSQTEDIFNLNLLQCLNCDELIYFNNKICKYEIEKLIAKKERYFIQDRNIVNEYPQKPAANGSIASLIHTYKQDLKIKLKLSFLKETDHAKSYRLTGYAVELRDETLRNKNLLK